MLSPSCHPTTAPWLASCCPEMIALQAIRPATCGACCCRRCCPRKAVSQGSAVAATRTQLDYPKENRQHLQNEAPRSAEASPLIYRVAASPWPTHQPAPPATVCLPLLPGNHACADSTRLVGTLCYSRSQPCICCMSSWFDATCRSASTPAHADACCDARAALVGLGLSACYAHTERSAGVHRRRQVRGGTQFCGVQRVGHRWHRARARARIALHTPRRSHRCLRGGRLSARQGYRVPARVVSHGFDRQNARFYEGLG